MVESAIVNGIVNDADKSENTDKKYAVEHSYVDFQNLIVNEKLTALTGTERGVFYGQQYFAELMVQENIEFYLQDEIQKFIDYQFVQTRRFFMVNLIIYLALFCVPFLLVLFGYKDQRVS